MNTKDKIMLTALELFSKRGYKAVSVNDIAGELSLSKGALYKHYKNKREIFDSILKKMSETDLRSKDAVVLRMLRLAVELHLLGTARFIAAQRWGQ